MGSFLYFNSAVILACDGSSVFDSSSARGALYHEDGGVTASLSNFTEVKAEWGTVTGEGAAIEQDTASGKESTYVGVLSAKCSDGCACYYKKGEGSSACDRCLFVKNQVVAVHHGAGASSDTDVMASCYFEDTDVLGSSGWEGGGRIRIERCIFAGDVPPANPLITQGGFQHWHTNSEILFDLASLPPACGGIAGMPDATPRETLKESPEETLAATAAETPTETPLPPPTDPLLIAVIVLAIIVALGLATFLIWYFVFFRRAPVESGGAYASAPESTEFNGPYLVPPPLRSEPRPVEPMPKNRRRIRRRKRAPDNDGQKPEDGDDGQKPEDADDGNDGEGSQGDGEGQQPEDQEPSSGLSANEAL
jgi:hypothetical protein